MRYVFALIALGLVVVVHELGHYVWARLFSIDVQRFSIGFGPPLLSGKPGATRFTLGAIPLGGFARIHGMNPHEPFHPEDWGSYSVRPAWHRMLVVLGGPLANYLFALLLLSLLYMTGTHVPVAMTIGQVEPGSAAARAQLRPGDVIVTVDGEPVLQWYELVSKVDAGAAGLELGLLRQGEPFKVHVKPHSRRGIARLGLSQQYVFRAHPAPEAFLGAASHIHRFVGEAFRLAARVVRGSGGLELVNPIPLVNQTSDTASSGLEAFLRVMVSLSVALTLFNLLPFPSLDGGRALFLLFELVARRRVPTAAETLAHVVGFLLLLTLLGFVAFRAVLPSRELPVAPQAVSAPGVETPAADAGVPTTDAGVR